ncbi:AraC family transcriptional regulator [Vagococcus elongatus]|uniref:AraC family transcriptional regulator n=1 Tax=Vagococcus elongatus TaxID=180344 RepID=A0A430B4G3_9ENTE|nr:AraC family transcriptional regulator [Vagococcus elongatus]RSU15217.1 AraC family transcriptional regulator [Vagococcus elongatus]
MSKPFFYERITPTENYPYKIFTFQTKSPDRFISPHWHESAELLFCLSGELEVSFHNNKYHLKGNESLFINSNHVHSSRSPIPAECLALQFPLDFLQEITIGKYYKNILFDLNPENTHPDITEILYSIAHYFSTPSVSNHLLVKSRIYEMFAILYDRHTYAAPEVKEVKSAKHLEKMRKINQYILENYTRDLSIEEVAAEFNYNSSYFSRFYKKFMGITFTEYLNSVRLETAYKELRDSDRTILEISLDSGFSNIRSFYNVFHKNFGLSPQHYRKKYFK